MAQALGGSSGGPPSAPGYRPGEVRREGFLSLDAGAAGGTLTTRPIEPGASRLELNAAVASAGDIRVEIQQPNGQPLPGFEAASCTPIEGDQLRHPVRWGERSDDEGWPQRSVRLRFSLREAQLYAFQFIDHSSPIRI